MVFVGHPEHGHWHIRGIARYELRRLGSSKPVRILVKRGFCLYDSSEYRLACRAHRARISTSETTAAKRDLSLAMGISVGWKDDYFWRIPGQIIDVTSVPLGKYRLYVKVGPRNWFRESNERNNVTWVDIAIGERLIRVLDRSPRV